MSLPGASLTADLPRLHTPRRWVLGCFLLTFGAYLSCIPQVLRYSNPPGGDQAWYMMTTISIVQDHDLDLHNNYDARDEDKFYKLAPQPAPFVGMPWSYPLMTNLAASRARPSSEWYNYHYPGLPFLLAPFWWAGGLLGLWWPAAIVFMCLVGALVGVNVFLLANELTGQLWIACAVWLSIAFSNPVMSFSLVVFTELLTGLMILYAARRLALGWRANGPLRLIVVGSCVGYLPMIAWRSVPFSVALGLYAVVQWVRYRRVFRRAVRRADRGGSMLARIYRGGLLPSSWLFLPAALFASLVARYNLFLFGTVIAPSVVPEVANQPIFTWPWLGMKELSRWLSVGWALLFDENFGTLPFAPVYLLSATGLIAMLVSPRRSDRRMAGWIALILGPSVCLIMTFEFWHGSWNPPGRYQTSWLPLLAAPMAISLAAAGRGWAAWVYRFLYAVLAIPGFLFMAVIVSDPRNLWPGAPGNLFEKLAGFPRPLCIDLRFAAVSFRWPDVVNNPIRSARLVAAAVAILLLCRFLLSACRRAEGRATGSPVSRPRRAEGLVWVASLLLIGLSWFVANRDYLRRKTFLRPTRRWVIEPHIYESRGIAYLDGSVFVTEYGKPRSHGGSEPGRVGAFDVRRGAYRTIQPYDSGGPVSWANPGDVKVGPDGLLYVLNNGGGDWALVVMKPEGEIVRHHALEETSRSCKGLAFGPGPRLYVSDQAGGSVVSYGLEGGRPEARFRGAGGGLNNPTGIWVDRKGTLFTSEGYNRVQEIDARGRWSRTYELMAPAFSFAASPGDDAWLDVGGPSQFFSIDRKEHLVRLSRLPAEVQAIGWLTGLTYSSDGSRLYGMDGSTLVEIEVVH